MKKILLIAVIALLSNISETSACTNFLVTKSASKDGSTFISYAADSHVLYGELYHWPAGTWPAGTLLDVYDWDSGKFLGRIPQAAQTYNVIGNMNEYQVAIGETTYGGREELYTQKGAIIDYGSMMYIALQRSKTAREALITMTSLVAEYGYASEGESISISDPNEIWIFELIGKGEGEKGAVWVARMVPDGYVSAHANQARITTFPQKGKNVVSSDKINKILTDKNITTVYSTDVISFARAKGYYPKDAKDADFSFSDTYNPLTFSGCRACELRVWAFFNRVADGMSQYWDYATGRNIEKNSIGYATNRMPLWILPKEKISLHQVMDCMRDHLEGTELDMAKDPGAGAFECPYRWRPMSYTYNGKKYIQERTTATQQTGFSFVSQSRSNIDSPFGGIIWFGVDDTGSTVYFPAYTCSTKVPSSFAQGNGSMMSFTNDAAFWVFNQVTNFAYQRYNVIHPEIRAKQLELENSYIEQVKQMDSKIAEVAKADKQLAISMLTDYSCTTGDNLTKTWRDFYGYLFCKYMDGNIRTKVEGQRNPKVENTKLPDWYLKNVVDAMGDKQLEIEK